MATSGGSAAVVYYAPDDFRIPLSVGAGTTSVVLSVAVSAAVYFRRAALDARAETAGTRVAAQEYVNSATVDLRQQLTMAQESVAEYRSGASGSENRRMAAMAAFAGAAGRMQAMTTSMLAELREMENRHSDADVLADLLQLDHRTAQAGRLADSIAVLSGARSGRRWAKPIAMQSILRGAMGRVAGYQRVRLRAVANIAIAGHAAEAVMHALAELIDNACNFSPPTTEVHLYAAEVPAGVIITIEDSGLVMSESALRRAEAAVAAGTGGGRASAPDLSSLSGTRLGLAVVGYLARKHGLTVSYRPSAIGGTAVVVVVPRDLTTRVDTTAIEPPITAQVPKAVAARPTPAVVAAAAVATSTELPKRRRGSTFAAVHPEGLGANPSAETAASTPARPDALGAFQRAITGREPALPTPSAPLETER